MVHGKGVIYTEILEGMVSQKCGFKMMVVCHQGGLSSGWSHQDGLSLGWSFSRVIFHQGGLSSGWSPVRVIFYQCGLIRVVSHLEGLSCIISLSLSRFNSLNHTTSTPPLLPKIHLQQLFLLSFIPLRSAMAVFFPDLVGEGAFSQVFRGKYQGAEVAIKRLNTPLSSQDKNYFAAEVSCSLQGDIQCCGQMQVTVIVSSAVQ